MTNASSNTSPAANWLRLAEYGDWPHPRGLQRLTPCAAHKMVSYFKSLRGRLARKFGGLPVYIGHPDDSHFSGQTGHSDTRAYAWVTDLQARRDGLYGAFKWSQAGEELLSNAFYKFLSPRWAMEALGKDVFEPVRLLSIGLTNQPNIPGEAIANSSSSCSQHSATGTDRITVTAAAQTLCPSAPNAFTPAASRNTEEYLAEKITEIDNATGDQIAPQDAYAPDEAENYALSHPTDDEAQICYRQLRSALGIGVEIDPLEAISELREQSERFYRIACEQSETLSRDGASLANARDQQADLIVQNALLSGRIAPHEATHWREQFENDWDGTATTLNARNLHLKTQAVANTRSTETTTGSNASDFLSRVEAHAKANALNFAQAWCDLKRRQPGLYQHFFATGN